MFMNASNINNNGDWAEYTDNDAFNPCSRVIYRCQRRFLRSSTSPSIHLTPMSFLINAHGWLAIYKEQHPKETAL